MLLFQAVNQLKFQLAGSDVAARYDQYGLSIFADGVQVGAAAVGLSGIVTIDDLDVLLNSSDSKEFEIVLDTTTNVANNNQTADTLRVSLVETQIKQKYAKYDENTFQWF
mgnify:CR=1 FL=1